MFCTRPVDTFIPFVGMGVELIPAFVIVIECGTSCIDFLNETPGLRGCELQVASYCC